MVTSTTIVKAALRVDLPQAASAGQAVQTTLNIVFTPEDELFLDGISVTREELATRVREVAASNPETQAVISADKSNPYGDVVALIDLVKLGGIKTFALNIERVAR
jgi:biopolymer transport protein ExbD